MMQGNIYCVGRNYQKHAEELGNDVPEKPLLFSKPTHAFIAADGRTVPLPKNQGTVHFETELVFKLARPYEHGMQPEDCIREMAVGLDLTLRDVQNELKHAGHPWLLAKGFPNSAVVTSFFSFEGVAALASSSFSLTVNGHQKQKGRPSQMIFGLSSLLEYCHRHFKLGEGDLLFTGTPEGVGPVNTGDTFEMRFNKEIKGTAVMG